MTWLTATWSLGVAIVVFAVAACAIGVFGVRLTGVVDQLSDATGLGQALAGAVLLGAATSLAGLVVTVVAAVQDDASLAISNSLGGIAAQTMFIVAADLAYRRANIEHASASLANVFSVMLLVVLLAVILCAVTMPDWTLGWISPATPVLVATYAYGVHVSHRIDADPMWSPTPTDETRTDAIDRDRPTRTVAALGSRFVALAAVVAVAGWAIGRSATSIIAETGIGATVVGALLTSVATSLPELVTTVAAVRAGALTMAVAGIIGGNTFDVLFVAVGDVAYTPGSIYAAAAGSDLFVAAWAILLAAVLGAGMIRRQRRGIGFEGITVLVAYLLGAAIIATM